MSKTAMMSDAKLLKLALDAEQEMLEKVAGVANGWSNGLVISGPPGVGKTHTVNNFLRSFQGLTHVSDVQTEQDLDKSSATYKKWFETSRTEGIGPLFRKSRYAPWSLVRDLWRNRSEGQIIVIDDNDLALQDLNFVGIIMSATEQEAMRQVHYTAKKLVELECEGVPDMFDYEGGIIILTNYNMRNVPKAGEQGYKKYHERWAALASRSAGSYVDMNMDDRTLLVFLEHRIRSTKQLTNSEWFRKKFGVDGISDDQQEQLFDYVRDIMAADALVQPLDLRVYNAMAKAIIIHNGDTKKWKDQIRRDLLKRGEIV